MNSDQNICKKYIKMLGIAGATILALVIAFLYTDFLIGKVQAAVEINEANFPDAAFRSVISSADYDRDGNGTLDDNELALTINIYCNGMGISSVKGIEYFTSLQGLYCTDNNISSWDLSNNKNLHGVWCSNNAFTSLDFSANPELEWVYCYDCNLTSLNVSNNPKMAYIECNTNPLPALDVSQNPLLEHLTCGTCELTSLNLSNNPNLSHLDAFGNHLTSLDVSHNPKMKRLDIWNNPGLGSIDVSHNPGLQYYNCAYNGATSINVTQNTKLQKLICSYNQISRLDLSKNTELVYLDCACNQIGNLDISNNRKLYFLQAFTNPFNSINIGDNPALTKTYKDGTKKGEYAVCQGSSWTIDYGGDTSTGGDNILFLCVDDKVSVNTTPSREVADTTEDEVITDKENALTREMVVQTLYEMAGKPDVSGLTTRFTDVEKGAWYEDAILWGEKNSICMGYPDISSDTFGVGKWIKRQDMVFMLMRYAEYKGYKRAIDFGRTDEFSDYYEIDYYAWEAFTWAVTWNFMSIKGDPNAPKSEQRLDPQGKATRAEFEYMVRGMLASNGASIDTVPIPNKSFLPEEKEVEIEEPEAVSEEKEDIEAPDDDFDKEGEDDSQDKNNDKEKLLTNIYATIIAVLPVALTIFLVAHIVFRKKKEKEEKEENNIKS